MVDKNRTGLDWEDVRFYAALARHGSLSAAARALAVNHATVARRVAALERTLGTALIERRPDGYRLTSAGRSVLQAASAMEAAAGGLIRRNATDPVTGLVRISATSAFAEGYLTGRLATFRAQNPAVEIELVSSPRSASLARREADLALRLGRPVDSDLIARRLLTVGFGFYANARWRHRLAAGAEPAFVGFDEVGAHLPESVWLARNFPERRIGFRTNTHIAQARAASAGHGIALLPDFLGRTYTGLVEIALAEQPPPRELWLLKRRDAARVAPVRLAHDFLLTLFRRDRALFESG